MKEERKLQKLVSTDIDDLIRNIKLDMPDNPMCYGYQVYSQCDEDGIINNCLERIGNSVDLSNTFIEFGCGNGLQNNSHYLLLKDFKGCWIDGNSKNIETIRHHLGKLSFKNLLIQHSFVTLGTIKQITDECINFLGTQEVDFLSMDLDGNDIYFLKFLADELNPKLICAEYNANFPPPMACAVTYDKEFCWNHDSYYGASLQALANTLDNYTLVSCNASGTNSFFIDKKYDKYFTKYNIEQLYQPPRYWLANIPTGHAASYKWLIQKLK